MTTIMNILAVGAGSCLGGISRYILSRAIQTHSAGIFPWGTFVVNLSGCLILGLLYGMIDRSFQLSENMRLFLTIGFCGGFTTLSTFAGENFMLLQQGGHLALTLVYILGTVTGGILLLFLGYLFTR